YQGSLAHLWSSTIVSSTTAYILATWSTLVQPAGSYNNAGGIALRCAIRILPRLSFSAILVLIPSKYP
ncbi:hypothetical protein IJG79_03025, partial [Candidatus Saccharibacteria bacterium]|nr:hypothetical protein [Candidatus Saccharibacteria bacterium]